MVSTCVRRGSNGSLDLLEITGGGRGETNDLGEQERHGLAFIGEEAHIPFRLSLGQDWSQRAEGALDLALRLQHQGGEHVQLDQPPIEPPVGKSIVEMSEQKSGLSERRSAPQTASTHEQETSQREIVKII